MSPPRYNNNTTSAAGSPSQGGTRVGSLPGAGFSLPADCPLLSWCCCASSARSKHSGVPVSLKRESARAGVYARRGLPFATRMLLSYRSATVRHLTRLLWPAPVRPAWAIFQLRRRVAQPFEVRICRHGEAGSVPVLSWCRRASHNLHSDTRGREARASVLPDPARASCYAGVALHWACGVDVPVRRERRWSGP